MNKKCRESCENTLKCFFHLLLQPQMYSFLSVSHRLLQVFTAKTLRRHISVTHGGSEALKQHLYFKKKMLFLKYDGLLINANHQQQQKSLSNTTVSLLFTVFAITVST